MFKGRWVISWFSLLILWGQFGTAAESIKDPKNKTQQQHQTAIAKQVKTNPKANNAVVVKNPSNTGEPKKISILDILKTLFTIIGVIATIIFASKWIKKRQKTAELEAESDYKVKNYLNKLDKNKQDYVLTLKKELEDITAASTKHFDGVSVKLFDTFVSLDLSHSQRTEERYLPGREKLAIEEKREQDQSPEGAIKRTITNGRVLLIIGEPGSGKSTLMQYYAMKCIHNQWDSLGFTKQVLPLFYRLRKLTFHDGVPIDLSQALSNRKANQGNYISAEIFNHWLNDEQTLVLLDGLDEISNVQDRAAVCRWIEGMVHGRHNAIFVVTSRDTGISKRDGVEIRCDYVRADVKDFTWDQQQEFIDKWFESAFKRMMNTHGLTESEASEKSLQLSHELKDFLSKQQTLKELVKTPVLLQMTVMLYKHRGLLFDNRSDLYEAAFAYLWEWREKSKLLEPLLLTVKQAEGVLNELAYWMQIDLHKDTAAKAAADNKMNERLSMLSEEATVDINDFITDLIQRSGLVVLIDDNEYLFRHKTFREYLAAMALRSRMFSSGGKYEGDVKRIYQQFFSDWWHEVLRFLMNLLDEHQFNEFWKRFFKSHHDKEFTVDEMSFVYSLIDEATHRKIECFRNLLFEAELSNDLRLFVVNCLHAVGSKQAYDLLAKFNKDSDEMDLKDNYAFKRSEEIIRGRKQSYARPETSNEQEKQGTDNAKEGDRIFYNPYEFHAEYILIPSGNYHDKSKDGLGKQKVETLYFAKYPVTNQKYNRFIEFLTNKESKGHLKYQEFEHKLREFAETVKGKYKPDYRKYLSEGNWVDLLRSKEHENKRFNEDEQPVVSVTWYAARAYAFWLSCLTASDNNSISDMDVNILASIYRLPEEKEWLWAAGRPEKGTGLKKYPWCTNEVPNEELANYNESIDKTTAVGSYPKGATVDGLMDMAGNVWEWQGNWYDSDEDCRAVRGGSWVYSADYLPCSARNYGFPGNWGNSLGFRVVRQSKLLL